MCKIITQNKLHLMRQHLKKTHQGRSRDERQKETTLATTVPTMLTQLENEWHYGPTGSGKSRLVREKYPQAYLKDTNEWWDGYEGEEVVLIENFEKSDSKLSRMLKVWADHYVFPANMKCRGKVDIRPKKIIVTSTLSPEEIWGSDNAVSLQIVRRFELVKYPKCSLEDSSNQSLIVSDVVILDSVNQ